MGDLDVSLIQEFAQRPGFYNRGDIHFKDKLYAEKAWNEISMKLGYDVPMLKDRIYQLRNRYNLEKRRLEQIKYENPNANCVSPWRLFTHLQFLDGHIRPRRSYKTMMKRAQDQEQFYDGSNLEHPTSSSPMVIINNPNHDLRMQIRAQRLEQQNNDSNSPVEIKLEKQSDDSEEDQTTCGYVDPTNYLADDGDEVTIEAVQTAQLNGAHKNDLEVKRLERKRETLSPQYTSSTTNNAGNTITIDDDTQMNSYPTLHPSTTIQRLNLRNFDSMKTRPDQHHYYEPPPAKKQKFTARSDKYEAFGKFLTHSLCDLAEDKALILVEKFTSEIVKSLIDNHNQNNPKDC